MRVQLSSPIANRPVGSVVEVPDEVGDVWLLGGMAIPASPDMAVTADMTDSDIAGLLDGLQRA